MSFTLPEKRFFFIYAVIVKQKFINAPLSLLERGLWERPRGSHGE
jgi:hypothetical protein